MEQHVSRAGVIKNIYLYLVALIGLLMVVFSVADVVGIVLRSYVFTKADQNFYYSYPSPACPTSPSGTPKDANCITPEQQQKMDADNRSAQRQRDLVRDISFILVGTPLFLFHWGIIRKKDLV